MRGANPMFQILLGLGLFYLGLKMFASGMKSLGCTEQLTVFLRNPYWMFLGGFICTLLWQSSSLSTTAIVGLVASGMLPMPGAIGAVLGANVGTTGTIWIASIMMGGITRQIAIVHTVVNLAMALILLPFVKPIAKLVGRL